MNGVLLDLMELTRTMKIMIMVFTCHSEIPVLGRNDRVSNGSPVLPPVSFHHGLFQNAVLCHDSQVSCL